VQRRQYTCIRFAVAERRDALQKKVCSNTESKGGKGGSQITSQPKGKGKKEKGENGPQPE